MDIVSFLNQGWVGIVIGVALTVAAFFASRKRAKPCAHLIASHELAWAGSPQLPPGIGLQFRTEEIPRIARGVFRFWNSGSEALESQKVSSADPLRLEIPDGKFLLVSIWKTTKDASLFKVEIDEDDPRIARVTFDFIDPKDGVAIGFLHTSTYTFPTLKGTIKGHPIALAKPNSGALRRAIRRIIGPRFFRTLSIVMIVIALVFMTASLFSASQLEALRNIVIPDKVLTAQEKAREFRVAMGFAGALYLATGCLILWRSRRGYPKTLEQPTRLPGD